MRTPGGLCRESPAGGGWLGAAAASTVQPGFSPLGCSSRPAVALDAAGPTAHPLRSGG